MKIAIGCDHAGVKVKSTIIELLEGKGYSIIDKGPFSIESVDYPDYGHQVAESVEYKEADLGVVICGSGNGMSITANRDPNIRAGLAFNSKVAELVRQHNDANILVLPGRFIDVQEAIKCVDNFINTNFEGGRHKKRIEKI